MDEAEWLTSFDLNRMWELIPTESSDRRCRLFAVACCSLYKELIREKRLKKAIRVGDRFANGEVSYGILRAAERSAELVPYRQVLREGVQQSAVVFPRYEFVRSMVMATVNGDARAAVRCCLRYPSFGQITDEADLLRDIFGNPYRPMTFDPNWRTSTVVALAEGIYADRAFERLPILADALEDAGCDHPDIFAHCRGPGPHVRGCWVVDLVLGKS